MCCFIWLQTQKVFRVKIIVSKITDLHSRDLQDDDIVQYTLFIVWDLSSQSTAAWGMLDLWPDLVPVLCFGYNHTCIFDIRVSAKMILVPFITRNWADPSPHLPPSATLCLSTPCFPRPGLEDVASVSSAAVAALCSVGGCRLESCHHHPHNQMGWYSSAAGGQVRHCTAQQNRSSRLAGLRLTLNFGSRK